MKFSCDQCSAQYMIADEKVGPKGVKVKCKKCAHIIIVKPQTADDKPAEEPAAREAAGADGGFGDMFGGSPFDGPTQAMSHEQLASLTATAASAGEQPFGATDPPAAAEEGASSDPFGLPPASAGFGGMSTDGGGLGTGDGVPGFGSSTTDGGGAPTPDFGGEGDFGTGAGLAGLGGSDGDTGFDAGFGDGGGEAPSASDLAGAAGGEGELDLDRLGVDQPARAPSSRPAGEKEWYVAVDESQIGPIDLHEIEARWDDLEIDEDSLAWKAGMQDWVPIAEIEELAYLITERPQNKPAAGAFSAATTGGGVSVGAGLGPVAFGGDAGGAPSGDVSWTPSAASALSSLVQDELTATPAAPEAPEAADADGSGMPSFGTGELFGGGNGGGDAAAAPAPAAGPTPAPAMAPVSPAADPFAGGAQWSMPKPERSGGIRGIHLAFGGMAVMFVALVVVVVFVFLTQPPATNGAATEPVANAARLNTPPKVADVPASGADGSVAPASAPAPASDSGRKATPSPRRDSKKGPRRAKEKRKTGNGGMEDILDSAPKPSSRPDKKAIDQKDVMVGVKKGMGAVMGCIKKARAQGELAPGRHTLVLEWSIQPSGKVANPKLKGPANVLGTSLPNCFARGMRKWRFPSSEKGAPVRNFPFGPFSIK